MIVVGFLGGEDGPAFEIARRAAATGARVEMVGAAAPGHDGDTRLLELAAAGIGHATVSRSGAEGLEPADLELALRYLPEVRAIVLVSPPEPLLAVAGAASGWSTAPLVLVGADSGRVASLAAKMEGSPIAIDPPARDPDGTFAGFVAALAVRLDSGSDTESALRDTLATLAADPA